MAEITFDFRRAMEAECSGSGTTGAGGGTVGDGGMGATAIPRPSARLLRSDVEGSSASDSSAMRNSRGADSSLRRRGGWLDLIVHSVRAARTRR